MAATPNETVVEERANTQRHSQWERRGLGAQSGEQRKLSLQQQQQKSSFTGSMSNEMLALPCANSGAQTETDGGMVSQQERGGYGGHKSASCVS